MSISRARCAWLLVSLQSLWALGCSCGPSEALDAGGTDAMLQPDSGIACTDDAACDDGLFCTGETRCVMGRCVNTPVNCDDGLSCTSDACSEVRRACEHVAPDSDRDGANDAACIDARGMPLGSDCDDADPLRFPGALEVCDFDGKDEDCDLDTRGNVDSDGDGFEDARCCNPMIEGQTTPNCGTDCDDARRTTNPAGVEVCNTLNDDCDARTDEGVGQTVYVDADRDGYGVMGMSMMACANAAGFSATPGDCNDAAIEQNPGQPEFCDGIDNDCNGTADDNTRAVTWYRDMDRDLYGSASSGTLESCAPQQAMGYSLLDEDCNDGERAISPLATELCNGLDDNCNGVADFSVGVNDTEDDDADGFLDAACRGPAERTDCDDRSAASGPGENETCDGRDNDCDAMVDEGATSAVFYRDLDGDSFGAASSGTIIGCAAMAGFVVGGGDCDDRNRDISPGAAEACNGLDDDCDGSRDDGLPAPALNNAVAECAIGGPRIVRCLASFDDCNGLASDGCEADLRSNEANCRFCGATCMGDATSMRACTNGECAVASCAVGRANCNFANADGCEVDTQNDPRNCGLCNQQCALPHVSRQTCEAGRCTFVAADCERGWANCDAMLDNGCERPVNTNGDCGGCNIACGAGQYCDMGTLMCRSGGVGMCSGLMGNCDALPDCETDLGTSVSHCGGCGRACTGGNTSWRCAGGSCTPDVCSAGFANCDGNSANGCEANTNSDIRTCGSCMPCFRPNASTTCNAGACTLGGCQPGFGNCNMDPIDGCETSTTSDPANCGMCGRSCTGPGVAASFCSAGNCVVASCLPGFGDCSAVTPGCETNVTSDPNNCGGCGISCGAGGVCTDGRCDALLQLAVGREHVCALRASGSVVCWGSNTLGQRGTVGAALRPSAAVFGVSNAIQLVTGDSHSCALVANGTALCWGDNTSGALGRGTLGGSSNSASVVVTATGTLDRIVQLFSGPRTTCALRSDRTLWCWGDNGSNQMGMVASTGVAVAHTAFSTMDRIFDVAITETSIIVQYIGFKSSLTSVEGFGNVPGPSTMSSEVLWYDASRIADVAAGRDHVCARFDDGSVECLGDNSFAQLGDGGFTSNSIPQTTLFTGARGLHITGNTTCIRNALGQVLCVGENSQGQISAGMPVVTTPTTLLRGGLPIVGSETGLNASGAGSYRTNCVIATNGSVFCQGLNNVGQFGNDTTVSASSMQRTLGLTP